MISAAWRPNASKLASWRFNLVILRSGAPVAMLAQPAGILVNMLLVKLLSWSSFSLFLRLGDQVILNWSPGAHFRYFCGLAPNWL